MTDRRFLFAHFYIAHFYIYNEKFLGHCDSGVPSGEKRRTCLFSQTRPLPSVIPRGVNGMPSLS